MGKITILPETTKNPITLIGERAGICFGADITDDLKNLKRGIDCIESGHGRTMDYPNVEIILEGYSARVMREWYTHIGCLPARLQSSTRYIDYKDFKYITPPRVCRNPKAKMIYDNTMKLISDSCRQLENLGVLREDTAMLLPLGMETKVVDKRDLRSVLDMAKERMCSRAYWEYRELMKDLCEALREYSDEWKFIVDNYMKPKCEINGVCLEKNSCGRVKKGAN